MGARSNEQTPRARGLAAAILFGLLTAISGCQSAPKDPSPLEQASVYFNDIAPLRDLNLSPDEVAQLAQVRQAGVGDDDCIAIIRLSRERGQPFTGGAAIAGLVRTGFSQSSLRTLVELDQLGLAGEAQVMKLAGLSDDVVLAIAGRRSAGQPVLSSAKTAALRNVQYSNAQIIAAINRGTTDKQADAIIAARTRGARGFVRQRGSRR